MLGVWDMVSFESARLLASTWVALGVLHAAPLTGCAGAPAGRQEPAGALDVARRPSDDAAEQAPETSRRVIVLDEVVVEDDDRPDVSAANEARDAYERSEVLPRLLRGRATLMRCYGDLLRHDPELGGRVRVELEIATSGSVSARLLENTSESEALGDCVLRYVRQLRFDTRPPPEPLTFTIPLRLTP